MWSIRIRITALACLSMLVSADLPCAGDLPPKPCSDDVDCSLNGVCDRASGACACDAGWKGRYCHQLKLAPVVNRSGLDQLRGAGARGPTSTWGGSVVQSDDGLFHMWASEISRHCGIHRWITNSVIVHAVSRGPPDWSFERREQVFPLFSHEPIVTRAPTGEYVMYLTHYDGDGSDAPTCNCTDGNSASGEPGCAGEPGGSANKSWAYSYMSYARSPDGPWSALMSLANVTPGTHTDQNLAPCILRNGSALFWSRWDIWWADNWRDASTYRDTGQAPDWNAPGGMWEGEDPSMWVDKRGNFHILSHNGPRGETGAPGDCGRHLFSESGLAGTWRTAPLLNASELGGCAYPRAGVAFADGTTRTFYRRERPHLVFAANDTTRRPIALTTAVIDSPTGPGMPGFAPPQRDASYTLLQAVLP